MSGAGAARGPTLRRQLLWALIPPMLLVVAAAGALSYTVAWRSATEAYDSALFDSARSLAQQIHLSAAAPSLDLPKAARDILLADPYDRVFFTVLDGNDAAIAGNAAVPAPPAAPSKDAPVQFYDAQIARDHVRVATYAIFTGAGRPAATVRYAETLIKRRRLSERLIWTVVLPLVFAVVIVTSIVGYGVRKGLAPLGDLALALGRRGWGDLRPVTQARTPDEVKPLVDALNDLIERLSASQEAQQRFIAEAAHQLRTPLAALAAQTERALLAADVESITPALTQLQSSARRVIRLVNQLLTLARAEPGNDPRHVIAPLDLSQLVQNVCREWVPEALQRSVDLGFVGEAGRCEVVGHEALLTEMLNNLIDNALRYGARAGGAITVRLHCGDATEISVEDDGPGIAPAERADIFERFHRLPGSPPGGSGLGLAIVREIARLHHGNVSVEERLGGGAVFRVRLSRSPLDVGQGRAPAAGHSLGNGAA
ncbi:MAG TPA: sensor histidine kinase N-terminal domain-containing protein [Burkholderiales bacterium]|nr:sensor histidine kinase N-terminal domain-containing protein [Burkholderiales bacterium]